MKLREKVLKSRDHYFNNLEREDFKEEKKCENIEIKSPLKRRMSHDQKGQEKIKVQDSPIRVREKLPMRD
jgi:hypothetical protein